MYTFLKFDDLFPEALFTFLLRDTYRTLKNFSYNAFEQGLILFLILSLISQVNFLE